MRVTSFLSAVVAVCGSDLQNFDDFVRVHSRKYRNDTKEFSERRAVYEANVNFALWQNSRPGRLWTAGVNDFADWNDGEISSLFGWSGNTRPANGGGGRTGAVKKHGFLQKQNKTKQTLASFVNWVSSGGVTNQGLGTLSSVRDQGPCGSCWAIAAATQLEAAVEVKRHQRIPFSAQQIIDCVPNPQECGGQGGCRGATVELAYEWILANGLAPEADQPYQGAVKQCLQSYHSASSFGMYDWEMLPRNKYGDLMQALMQAPVAVSVAATGWVHYMNGIFDSCPNEAVIDHAVVSYGFGEEGGSKFWNIQNSWGQYWGEGGRMKLLRTDDDDNKCGWNHDPKKGTGCKGGEERVWVCGECGVLYDSVIAHIN